MSKLAHTLVTKTSLSSLKESAIGDGRASTTCTYRLRLRFWAPAIILGVLASRADAQTLLSTVQGANANEFFGTSVAGAGDFNNDGFMDFIVGAPSGGAGAGSATVFSGANGSVIATFVGTSVGDSFGTSVDGAGDFNNDGFDDIVVGAPNAAPNGPNSGTAIVISGQTLLPIVTFNGAVTNDMFGSSVAGIGDFNNDGFDDIVVGAPNASPVFALEGSATVFSGATQAAAALYFGGVTNALMGTAVSGAGDFDNDGFRDIAVGLPTTGGIGVVQVISVVLNAFLGTVTGLAIQDGTGFAIGDVGDVDGDGNDDIIVGMAGAAGGGSAQVFLGPTAVPAFGGALLQGPGATANGTSVAGAGDLDADGVPDLIVGSLGNYANVYSGLNGALLFTLNGTAGGNFGVSVDGIGQADGNGFDEIAIGDDMTTGGALNSGIAQVFTLVQFLDLCNGDGGDQMGCTNCPCGNESVPGSVGGCLNSTFQTANAGTRLIGAGSASVSAISPNDLAFTLSGAPPTAFCILQVGPAIAPTNPANPCFLNNPGSGANAVAFDGLRCAVGGTLRVGGQPADVNGNVTAANNTKWGGANDPLNPIASRLMLPAGSTQFFQVIHRDDDMMVCGTGLNTSQAVQVVFTP